MLAATGRATPASPLLLALRTNAVVLWWRFPAGRMLGSKEACMQGGGYREEFGRGWRIVLAGAVGTAFGISALPFYTLGVFVKPVSAEFGWTREAVQWGFAVQMFGMVVVGWLFGLAVDRYGARRVALLSQVGLAVALAGLSLVGDSLVHWYAAWFLVALLGAGTSPITWTRGIAGWFDRARGAALGLGLLGTGITGLVAPPLVTAIVEAYGWRAGYLALGASVILIALPLIWWLFRDREQAATAAPLALEGVSRAGAFRNYRFWVMLVVFALVTFGVGGLIPSLVPLLTDRGLTPAEAAGYASLAGLAVIVGRVAAGFLLDRFWAPAVAVGFLVLPAASCLVLAQGGVQSPVVIGLAAAFAGLAAGAEFDLVAFMVTRYFGMRHYGVIYAVQLVGLLFAGGLAPPLFGRIYDTTGSYDAMLLACAAIFILSPLLLLTLGRYPSFAKTDEVPAVAALA
jgi:MFS family permease